MSCKNSEAKSAKRHKSYNNKDQTSLLLLLLLLLILYQVGEAVLNGPEKERQKKRAREVMSCKGRLQKPKLHRIGTKLPKLHRSQT